MSEGFTSRRGGGRKNRNTEAEVERVGNTQKKSDSVCLCV